MQGYFCQCQETQRVTNGFFNHFGFICAFASTNAQINYFRRERANKLFWPRTRK